MKFANNEASESDLVALRSWLAEKPDHRAAFEQINQVWDGFGHAGLEFSPKELTALAVDAPPRLGRRAVLGAGVSASLAGLAVLGAVHPPLGLWPSWAELHAKYRTATGEQRHLTLPDGVAISMNTRTSIATRPVDRTQTRIELIAGEAIIDTPQTTSSPFTVVAGNGRVVATDARFDIWRDARSVCVTCLAGQLTVYRQKARLMLFPDQQVLYSEGELGRAVTVDPSVVTSWLSGVVIFRLTPVSQVIEVINRYRPGKIILTNAALGRRFMNARFRIQDIARTVAQIEQVFGAHVTNLPGGVILIG